MTYRIRFNYDSGDSFNQYPGLEDVLEESWSNLEIVEENIKRIEEHYEFVKRINRARNEKDLKFEIFKVCLKDWFVSYENNSCLKLKADNGNEYQIWPPWIGYFESLNFVEIITNTRIEFT